MEQKINLVACDAGSMDAGPYYLGKGHPYVEKTAVKRDLSIILDVALQQNCPLIIGNCGFSGDTPHLHFMKEILAELLAERNARDIKVAVVDSHVDDKTKQQILRQETLTALGQMPEILNKSQNEEACVAQMGIAPIITALNEGAQIVLAGRACDVALFAADPIRQGYNPGICYHAGHILECGALACDPGTGSDCIIAEFAEDGESAEFYSPNQERRTTVRSIAAHSLYEESTPYVQHYPEGVLSLTETEYYQSTPERAGIRYSKMIHRSNSVKLESAARIGNRLVSLVPVQPDMPVGESYRIYGVNGVQDQPLQQDQNELGILIHVSGQKEEQVGALASILKAGFLHFGYPNRRTSAGNMAFPTSPSAYEFKNKSEQRYEAVIIGGTRSQQFIAMMPQVIETLKKRIENDYPALAAECDIDIRCYDKTHPLLFLDTVTDDEGTTLQQHQAKLESLSQYMTDEEDGFKMLEVEDCYRWNLFHVITNKEIIEGLFPIDVYQVNGANWKHLKTAKAIEQNIGIEISDKELEQIEQFGRIENIHYDSSHQNARKLVDMASVIRSKNAGVNTLTYDIFFNSKEDYQLAVNSGAFSRDNICRVLNVPESQLVGVYRIDGCNAIKISRYQTVISGSPGTRDVFGAQQQLPLEMMTV